MSAPTFTVLLPVTRPPDLLEFAVGSVLGQSRQEFELFIVCDGAPSETAQAARGWQDRDPRVRALVYPKGERHGEAHRHLALQQARGSVVCQIADDDLWYPDHLAEMGRLAQSFDFGATLQLSLDHTGSPFLHFSDLAEPLNRERMLHTRFNIFGPTAAFYRLETYRALPVGWSPAPEGMFSDLHMWRKLLALPGVRCGAAFTATSLMFPEVLRRDWSPAARREEIGRYARLVGEADFREQLWRRALALVAARLLAAQLEAAQEKDTTRRLSAALEKAEAALKAAGA
jgi:glycosyltransferase involved in cell wall biosynthesis